MIAEWHITPEYILNNWTEEEFELMVRKLTERKRKEMNLSPETPGNDDNLVSDEVLFRQLGKKLKVVGNH